MDGLVDCELARNGPRQRGSAMATSENEDEMLEKMDILDPTSFR